jgi:hypothetical protein
MLDPVIVYANAVGRETRGGARKHACHDSCGDVTTKGKFPSSMGIGYIDLVRRNNQSISINGL